MEEERIDLNKLSHRELLIMLHSNVKEMKDDMKDVTKRQHDQEVKVSNIETRNKVWAGVMGFFTALASIFIERQLK